MKMRGMKKNLFFASFRMKAASGPCGFFFYAWCFLKLSMKSVRKAS